MGRDFLEFCQGVLKVALAHAPQRDVKLPYFLFQEVERSILPF